MKKGAIALIALTVSAISFTGAIWLPWTTVQGEISGGDVSQFDVEVRDLSLLAQSESTVQWQVLANRAIFSQTDQYARIHDVDARISGGASGVWRITASQGRVDSQTGSMLVEGQVRIRQPGGYMIDTETVHWDTVDHVLYTDTPVVMHNATVSITGRGLYGQVDRRRLTVERNVRARFRLPESR